jgi:putative ABC transport system ATP-binding protein
MKKIIECQNIVKNYTNGEVVTQVLKNISFSVEEGEFLAITGPSGSGKSTMMHILGALDTPTSGEYYLDGADVSKLSDNELAEVRGKKIGFIFQSFNLLSRATVMRNVELPLVYANVPPKDREARARQALRSAALDEERYYNLSNQLSGGQMQRVAIARSLVNNPAILLADEPTGNLDQKTGFVVLDTIQRLNSEGRTIVLITHDLHVAEHARRIIQIRDGEIIEDVKNDPKKPSEAVRRLA